MKERTMADLLIGETRFDLNRKPDNVEISPLTVLTRTLTEQTFTMLASNAEQAARLPKASEAVSVVSSIVAATAVMFPRDVLITSADKTIPKFFKFLDERRAFLDKLAAASDTATRQQYYWGVSVGLIQIFYHPPDFGKETGNDGGVTEREYFESLRTLLVPRLLKLVTWNGFHKEVAEMPLPLFTRMARIIADFAKGRKNPFELLVTQLVEQKEKHSPRTRFGQQILGELSDRFWYTRTADQKEAMVKK